MGGLRVLTVQSQSKGGQRIPVVSPDYIHNKCTKALFIGNFQGILDGDHILLHLFIRPDESPGFFLAKNHIRKIHVLGHHKLIKQVGEKNKGRPHQRTKKHNCSLHPGTQNFFFFSQMIPDQINQNHNDIYNKD